VCVRDISRRTFARSLAALAGSSGALARPATAQPSGRRRIDVHNHILPPDYVTAIGGRAIGGPALNPGAPPWDVASALAAMDGAGVTGAVVSVSAPGMLLDDAAATRRLTRSCNQFSAQMVADHPGRFGMFASLPLPEVKAALTELDYALDVLKADGVILMSNYRDRYLGDPAFAPLFDALNARRAVVFVHPTTCRCGLGVLPDVPASMIEFPHDTTRTITSLLFSGTFTRCPDIRFIFPHAGGTLPFLANRIASIAARLPEVSARNPQGVLATLRQLNYDTASAAAPMAFAALMQLVTPNKVLLGTDFPFAPAAAMRATVAGLGQLGLDEGSVRAIEVGNAEALFPRFAGV
jgi:predicted TIM-barrel fold metal-dependent hydrolase